MSNHPSFEGFPEEYSEAEIDESYDWVEHQTQKYFRAHMIGWVLGKVMRPIVTYEDEDALQEMIDADFAFNMVAKHTDLVDPFAADAAVHTEPALRHLQETRRSARKAGRPGRPRHTRPMSKIELSRKSDEVGRIANPLIRTVAGTPVPRSFTSPGEKGRYAEKSHGSYRAQPSSWNKFAIISSGYEKNNEVRSRRNKIWDGICGNSSSACYGGTSR